MIARGCSVIFLLGKNYVCVPRHRTCVLSRRGSVDDEVVGVASTVCGINVWFTLFHNEYRISNIHSCTYEFSADRELASFATKIKIHSTLPPANSQSVDFKPRISSHEARFSTRATATRRELLKLNWIVKISQFTLRVEKTRGRIVKKNVLHIAKRKKRRFNVFPGVTTQKKKEYQHQWLSLESKSRFRNLLDDRYSIPPT